MTKLFSSGAHMLACSLIGLFAAVPIALAENKCQGDPQTHDLGNFQFQTYSWMEPAEPLNRYYTCVFNMHENHDVRINWYIPGPRKTYMPPGVGEPFPRRREDSSRLPLHGCLEYGYLGDTLIAEFIGTHSEEQATNSQREQECREENGLSLDAGFHKASDEITKGWVDTVTLYFPSDTEEEHESLLKLEATYGVDYIGDNRFVTYFKYAAEPYEGREKGNPDDVSYVVAQPEMVREHGDYNAALRAGDAPPTPLGFGGDYFSEAVFAEEPSVVPTVIGFLDRHGKLVSMLEIASVGPALQ